MSQFALHIVGCGSAGPSRLHYPTSQILDVRGKQFMIDCGEGTQFRILRQGAPIRRLGHIFISHLHGDHCFGLIGLISTMGMMKRTADLHIHALGEMEKLLPPLLDYFCRDLPYKVLIEPFGTGGGELIYEDRSIRVETLALKHRVPCCGFHFVEKESDRHIRRDMIDFYRIPLHRIAGIKAGEDFTTEEGDVIPNARLTEDPTPAKRYAYCSDTASADKAMAQISGVDCLYHEATFQESDNARAAETLHSTARQAAEVAARAGVKRLVLGHFSARYDRDEGFLNEARAIFPRTELAREGRVFEF